jgi:GT2 family glycosyltransferase
VQEVVDGFSAGDERIIYRRCTTETSDRPLVWSLLIQSSGEFVGVFEPHDELAPEALLALAQKLSECPDTDLMYSDHDRIDASGDYVDPFFKPGWSPDLLLSMNYLGPLCLFRRTLLVDLVKGGISIGSHGLHGLLLRLTEEPRRISHVPLVLCHARARGDGQGIPDEGWDLDQQKDAAAITEALQRRGEPAVVNYGGGNRFLVSFEVVGAPLVSIIIPTRDHGDLLERCIQSIEKHTRQVRYEIIVVDNGTTDDRTRRYLDSITTRHRVIRYPGPFNYSAINNEGVKQAAGGYLLFLNNDTEVLSSHWLSAMVAHAQRPGVGAVGAKLLYPDGRIQHAGVVLGLCGVAGHAFRHCPSGSLHYHGLSDCMRNCSAVTAACMMVTKRMFAMAGGFDELLPVEFNDVDLCLRIQCLGARIVYVPEAVLYHHENATRKGRRAPGDEKRFALQWEALLAMGDPYYNPNLTRRREDWSLDI